MRWSASRSSRVRPTGGAALVAGFIVILAARIGGPLAVPLYDGVIVVEPYRYLSPGTGQAGSPTVYDVSTPISSGASPSIAAATKENPPQAQLIASPGAVALAATTTAIRVKLEPVTPTADEPSPLIAGNVYRLAVIDQSGAGLGATTGTSWTLVLRAPAGVSDASIGRFADGSWQSLPTQSSSQPGIFATNISSPGDYAVLATPASGLCGLDPGLIAAIVVVLGVVLVGVAASAIERRASVRAGTLVTNRPRLKIEQPAGRPDRPVRRRRGGSKSRRSR